MLDAVDRVIKLHIQNLLSIRGKPIRVFATATADQDDQVYSQAGTDQKPDEIPFPFASLIRMPQINITDSSPTKQIHNYSGYELNVESKEGIAATRLSYYRCTLHYSVTIFAETRKMAEDVATALYGRLRNQCQVDVSVHLPVEVYNEEKPFKIQDVVATMKADIEMGDSIEEVNPLKFDQAQVYKCRIQFDVKNVNVYTPSYERKYTYNIYVTASLDDDGASEPVRQLIFSSKDNKPTI